MKLSPWVADHRRKLTGRPIALTIAAWCAVRVVQWSSGVEYSDAFLDHGWQLVPRETLRADVLGSVWYLHVQPPLYNLTIGILLRFSPLSDARSTQLLILSCSLLAAIGLHRLAVLIGFSNGVAIVLATVLLADPFMIRYELEPTYEIPVLAMVVWSLILLHRAATVPTTSRFAAVSLMLTAVVMTRSLFHPLWLVIVLIGLFVAVPRVGWRPIVVAAAIPAVCIGTWMIKNEAMFGDSSLSSWLGMNLERGVIAPMNRDRVDDMIATGVLPEIVTVPPFVDYDNYVPYLDTCVPTHDNLAVTQPRRPDGFADFNYECFLPVYSKMFDASVDAVRHRPVDYLSSRLDALKFSLDHLEEAGYGKGVLRIVRPIYRIAFLDVHSDIDTSDWYHPLFGPGTVILYPSIVVGLALLACCVEFVRRAGRLRRRPATPDDLLRAACAFTVVWVAATGALLEMGENARFRTMVHPVMILLLAAVTSTAWKHYRESKSGPTDEQVEVSSRPSAAS